MKINYNNSIKGYKILLEENNYQEGDILHGEDYPFYEKLIGALNHNQLQNNINIAQVEGYGDVKKYISRYYDYKTRYTASDLKINKILSHDDIINLALSLNELELAIFVCEYKLTNEEIAEILTKYPAYTPIQNNINYFQKANKAKIKLKKK